jgi:5-methyltetrahydrofolate--homocysteine methyltransferase
MAEARPAGVFLMAQSNAGLPKLVGDEFLYDGSPEVMAEWATDMRALGIDVIGACCGSTPEHIAAMRDIVTA